MKIKWLAHASFLITSEKGTRIITDPYTVAGGITYAPIEESADVVTVSHDHGDHSNVKSIKGNPQVVKGQGIVDAFGITFRGINSDHDDTGGSQRGKSTIFCLAVDGINLCHLGDLGNLLNDQQIADIGAVDILLIPVGGYYTIDARQATEVVKSVKPKVAIPMHYKTEKCNYPITGVDEFLKDKQNVRRLASSEVAYKKGELPDKPQILVLEHAL
jgi:L-ascorbate metabolism protein UlaG (beta-lactamase superfamily)